MLDFFRKWARTQNQAVFVRLNNASLERAKVDFGNGKDEIRKRMYTQFVSTLIKRQTDVVAQVKDFFATHNSVTIENVRFNTPAVPSEDGDIVFDGNKFWMMDRLRIAVEPEHAVRFFEFSHMNSLHETELLRGLGSVHGGTAITEMMKQSIKADFNSAWEAILDKHPGFAGMIDDLEAAFSEAQVEQLEHFVAGKTLRLTRDSCRRSMFHVLPMFYPDEANYRINPTMKQIIRAAQ